METFYKRYCKILTLKDDPELIKQYKEIHAINKAWPEVTKGMKEAGIIDMEIYIHGNILFMIMDTVEEFDHNIAMAELASKPRQQEWESYVSRFQNARNDASAEGKWILMERIYEMDQETEFKAISGQVKKIIK
ncbi:MAG: L-rhamnose mutarotase [Bacteroidales bacterium]|jgi:L-rhamnose mutarotase